MNLKLINAKVELCNKCKLSPNRGLGYGDGKSKIMFIAQNAGWQPKSRTADIIPFGLDDGGNNSGRTLVKLFKDVEMNAPYYITNVMKCPTPDNRPPTDDEIFRCIDFLRLELESQKPKLIFVMGNVAKHSYNFYMKRLLKKLLDDGHCWFVHYMWHPRAVMRNPKLYAQWKTEFDAFWTQYKHLVKQ